MPSETIARIPYALCAYSMPHTMGYLATKGGESANPLSLNRFVDWCAGQRLAGVEFPLMAKAPVFDGGIVETLSFEGDLAATLQRLHLRLVADYGALLDYDAEHTIAYLKASAAQGARVVRCILSHILCGDRRSLSGGWGSHLDLLASRLKQVLPAAEELGITLAVENHQDATSEDLLRLFERSGSSAAFGVTLDTGNPLAVAEDPIEYTARIAHLVRHIHLKDYTMHIAPEGYRLVRCAAGDGVIDFRGILSIVLSNGAGVLPAIEIAAQAARTIPVHEKGWWQHYPGEQAEHLSSVLNMLGEKGRPADEPYSSCWERGGTSADVVNEEWDLVTRSISYFRSLA